MKKNKKKEMKVPFYANLLTKQEMHNTGGTGSTTPLGDAQTQKYPSDQEDTNPLADQPQTQKYPSDQEDTNPKADGLDG